MNNHLNPRASYPRLFGAFQGKMAVVKALGKNTTLDMDAVPEWLMPFLGATEVSKIAKDDIFGALEALKDAQPTVEAVSDPSTINRDSCPNCPFEGVIITSLEKLLFFTPKY